MPTRLFALVAVLAVPFVAACSAGSDDLVGTDDAPSELRTGTNDLSSAQQKDVLALLADHCSDSWCESDDDYDFRTIKCTFAQNTCTVAMKVAPGGQKDKAVWRSCKLHELNDYSGLVESLGPNHYKDLTDDFYEKVDNCIADLHVP